MRIRILKSFAALPAVALFALAGGAAQAADPSSDGSRGQTSSLEPGLEQEWRDSNLPALLSNADIGRYRVVFQLQKDGEWKAADKIIAKLDDRVLMGHVLAQRYLHPTKYRSRYKELKSWMDSYADHPQARRLYQLALKRKPRNWKAPKPPTARAGVYLGGSGHGGGGSLTYRPSRKLNAADAKKARSYERKLRWYTRKGWTKSVKQLIQTKEVKRLLHSVTYDRARATLGKGYLVDGRPQWALNWAGAAAKRSGKYLPNASWTAGLAAWQLGKFEDAAGYFSTVAISRYSGSWLRSAGGFWASRAYLKARQPEKVNHWLGQASAYPHTFYGMLARETLGLKITFNWAPPPFAMEAMTELSDAPGGRRAVTLMQVGEDRRAERELRILFGKASPELARAMLALADRADMPTLAMRLGGLLARNGASHYDSTAYPVPTLSVDKDTLRDPALVLALIRQESGFNPRAKSSAGARGLMQLMPGTASHIAQDRRYRRSKREALYDPETNITLGQRYIEMLFKEASVNGDILRMAAAWNGGPGNLRKWQRRLKITDDPLLFIETIPLRETRNFIERVLTNLWIYRARFDQPTPTLRALAEGDWPAYQPVGDGTIEIAEDDRRPN